jgi:AcrR family transcriptional regulator
VNRERQRQILDAALALADERGLDSVSMRSVAQRVGVTPMALYPFVGSKAALLEGMVDRLLAELPVPDPELGWRERLATLARALRVLARAHPSSFPLLLARPAVSPDSLRVVETIFQALSDAGLPIDQVPRLERMVSTFVLGYAASEVNGRFSPGTLDTAARRDQLSPAELPVHHKAAFWLDRPVDWDAEFEADLADVLAIVGRAAGDSPGGGAV